MKHQKVNDKLAWYETELLLNADKNTHKPLTYGQRLHRRSYLSRAQDINKGNTAAKEKRYQDELRTGKAPNGKPLTYGQKLFRNSYLSHAKEVSN